MKSFPWLNLMLRKPKKELDLTQKETNNVPIQLKNEKKRGTIYRLNNSIRKKYLIYSKPPTVEFIYFPKIYKLCRGGKIRVSNKGVQIYKFKNASFLQNSDFIRLKNKQAFVHKWKLQENIFTRFGDEDLIEYNKDEESCRLRTYKKSKSFDCVFHMSGCFSRAWSHFLIQNLHRLSYLKSIEEKEINIVLPKDCDSHILGLIKFCIKKHNNVNLVHVESERQIFCRSLYYCSTDSHLGDIGTVPTLFHIQTSNETVKYICQTAEEIAAKLPKTNLPQKIFIGRKGEIRNIENYKKIWQIFKSAGFKEIFPHLYSLDEKASLFKNAKYIAGPGSSGFSNIIFSSAQAKVLIFVNATRHADMYLTKIAQQKKISLESIVGSELNPGQENSNYFIDPKTVLEFIQENWGNIRRTV
jgi:capsular polysaccharide biosynthesis protein